MKTGSVHDLLPHPGPRRDAALSHSQSTKPSAERKKKNGQQLFSTECLKRTANESTNRRFLICNSILIPCSLRWHPSDRSNKLILFIICTNRPSTSWSQDDPNVRCRAAQAPAAQAPAARAARVFADGAFLRRFCAGLVPLEGDFAPKTGTNRPFSLSFFELRNTDIGLRSASLPV